VNDTAHDPATDEATASVLWDGVVGQDAAVRRLERAAVDPVHAYLFVGPAGSTSDLAARAFAGLLLSGTSDATHRDNDLALRGEHPDVHEIRREGASISADQAREIVRLSSRSPVEGDRKVLILHEFHLLAPEGAARLLKTIEEPPPSTIFVILADFVPRDLITIASRCARIDFHAIADSVIIDHLEREGVAAERAHEAALAARGDWHRARLLASDPELAARRTAFAAVPYRLDGTGAVVMRTVDELLGLIEAAAAPLVARHDRELVELEERIARSGERGSGKAALATRHKRELRRHRTDELLAGLATIAGVYRDALAAGTMTRPEAGVEAVHAIHHAMEAFAINANEALLLQALLWSLPTLGNS
jgi:DNA polymerase-3 subunit delta'